MLIEQYWSPEGVLGIHARAALRTLQFAVAVATTGLYAADLPHWPHRSASPPVQPTNWIYALVVAALSILTCALHLFVTVTRVAWTAWDFVLAVLWAALTGVFAGIFYGRQPSSQGGGGGADGDFLATGSVARMRAAVWLDLVAMVLWLATALAGCVWCCRARRVTRRTDDKVVDAGGRESSSRMGGPGDVELGRRP